MTKNKKKKTLLDVINGMGPDEELANSVEKIMKVMRKKRVFD